MTYEQRFKKTNNKNVRAGNKTFMLQMASEKDYLRMSGYIIFGYGKPKAILKSYPDEFRFLIKTQKMLKYESPH